MKSSYIRLCYRQCLLRQETGDEQKKYPRLKWLSFSQWRTNVGDSVRRSVGWQVRARAVVMTTCKQTLGIAGTHTSLDTSKQIDAVSRRTGRCYGVLPHPQPMTRDSIFLCVASASGRRPSIRWHTVRKWRQITGAHGTCRDCKYSGALIDCWHRSTVDIELWLHHVLWQWKLSLLITCILHCSGRGKSRMT